MMYREEIIPFKGTASFELYQNIESAKAVLDSAKVGYVEELWESSSETIPNPWKVIVVEGIISLFFARNDKLFKIIVWENYAGCLPNGIHTGMSIAEAKKLDSTLSYSDWNEDFESEAGYWLEDDVETGTVMSISVFIREALDEENFDYCKW
ncbi:MAG: hypothetical protein Q4B32_06915 [Clostridia bacterium]|nr:hypothetical protein [Clostridia bacterium]